MFYQIVRNYLMRKPIQRPLGRWNPSDNSNLKAHYANLDSCGDKLCGDPKYYIQGRPMVSGKNMDKKVVKSS